MKETGDTFQFGCPVCSKTIIDFGNVDCEYLQALCSHVVLVHSMDEFIDVDESIEEVVDEMERRMEEDKEITVIELMAEYADNSNGEYQLFCLDDPNSVPLLYVTICLLIKMLDDTQKNKNTGKTDMVVH